MLRAPVDMAQEERFGWRAKVVSRQGLHSMFGTKPWILWTGCFDGKDQRILPGHLSLLQSLAAIAPVVVGIESDRTLWWNKGMFRPQLHMEERIERLAKRPEVAAVLPFDGVMIYNPDAGIRTSKRFADRFRRIHPPIVPIYCFDPMNPYGDGMNANAKEIGATRLVYDYFPSPSTSRVLGY
jgi:hypothetical protein